MYSSKNIRTIVQEDVYEMMAIPDRYRVYLTALRGDGNMVSTIQLAPEAEKRIDSLVARTGRSKDFFLKEIIKRGLEDIEDYYLAADLLEGVRKGTEAVYSNKPS